MRACSLVSADGVIVLEMPSASRPLARYRQQAAKLPSAFRVVSKKLGGRPRPGRVLALAPPPGMHHLSQFQCWKLDGGRPTTTPAADPVDDELLTTKPPPNSFRAVIGHLIVTGHIIGMLPVSSAVDALPLFFWLSPRVVLSLCTATVVLLRIGMYVWSVYRGYMSAFDTLVSTRLGFHILSTVELLLYVRLARRWRPFVLCFLRVERRQGEDALSPRLRLQAKVVTGVLMSLALGELLLQVTTFALPKEARDYTTFSALLQAHYEALYDNMAQALPYSVPSLLLAEFTTAATNFVLNYNDVFVIIVSIAIVRRFKIIRGQLGRATTQDDAFDWKHARESFNDLSQLTREVDNTLSSLVLLSCLNNFFSICIQLQHTVRPSTYNPGFARKVYFLFSFTFVMLRSAAVVLSASCIPEESKAVKRVLYAVPTKQYSEEVQRFLTQVTTDEIALTGLGLFSITRSFILTMLGTIATYEILLVQMYRT